jgi:hypothetical protein
MHLLTVSPALLLPLSRVLTLASETLSTGRSRRGWHTDLTLASETLGRCYVSTCLCTAGGGRAHLSTGRSRRGWRGGGVTVAPMNLPGICRVGPVALNLRQPRPV